MFALVLTPWIIRNETVSGTAFGTAGYAVVEGTFVFPRFQLERSVHPELTHAMSLDPYVHKLLGNLRGNLIGRPAELRRDLGGRAFFCRPVPGLPQRPGARRMRYFLLMCLGVFIVAQSLGRTQLSEQSPEINSENLLVLLVPLVFIFGASFFFTLLDQMTLPLIQLRYAVIAGFVALCVCRWFSRCFRPEPRRWFIRRIIRPEIQQIAGWMKPDELMMSDVPWAVAWYGHRQCVWLSLDAQDDFFAINDYLKPVQALYLTPQTMDGKFVSEWVQTREFSWGNFIVDTVVKDKIPPGVSAPQCTDRIFARPAVFDRPRTLENGANKFKPPRAAAGPRCRTIPAIPAAPRRQSTGRPPRRSGAVPRKAPAQTPPHRAASRSRRQNFRPMEFSCAR